jgi:hypothetical protein
VLDPFLASEASEAAAASAAASTVASAAASATFFPIVGHSEDGATKTGRRRRSKTKKTATQSGRRSKTQLASGVQCFARKQVSPASWLKQMRKSDSRLPGSFRARGEALEGFLVPSGLTSFRSRMTVAGRQGRGAGRPLPLLGERFGAAEATPTPDWSMPVGASRGDADAGFGPVLKPILVSADFGLMD